MVSRRLFYIILANVMVFGIIELSFAAGVHENWPAPNEYWAMIRKIAAEQFKGINLELSLNTGYNFGDGDERGLTMGFSVPIYSKKDRIKVHEEAVKFLHQGAELIASLEEAIATRKIHVNALQFLKARMNDEGIEAAKAYFDMLTKIAHQDALIVQFHRQLQSLIKPFSSDVEIVNVENVYEHPEAAQTQP